MSENTAKISVYVPEHIDIELRVWALRNRSSLSYVVGRALCEFLENHSTDTHSVSAIKEARALHRVTANA